MAEATCSIADCEKPTRARGWCVMHYARWRKYGDVEHREILRGDPLARFWAKVDRRADDECWPWLGQIDRDGYGRMSYQSKKQPAARVAYLLLVGPIPDGLQIDHVHARGCRRRDCVNPAHLEPVTPGENVRRAEPARRTHCPHGHEYTPDNTTLTSGTGRTCLTCRRADNRRRRERERAASL